MLRIRTSSCTVTRAPVARNTCRAGATGDRRDVASVVLQVFGQPQRELPCECERSTDSNLSQALQLINGPTVHNKLRSDAGSVHQWITSGKTDAEIIDLLYLTALSRPPLPEEHATAQNHIKSNDDRTRALEDVAWAVINSKEFLFQH